MIDESKVRDAMSAEVIEIPDDATLAAAARRMATARVNSLIVRPEGKEEPFGILTSTDLVDAISDGLDLESTRVGAVATAPLVNRDPGNSLGLRGAPHEADEHPAPRHLQRPGRRWSTERVRHRAGGSETTLAG